MYIIVGLGNKGEEYRGSRHNVGREMLLALAERPPQGMTVSGWQFDKKLNAHVAPFQYEKEKGKLILPETFMNLSGKAIAPLIKNIKEAEHLIVVHDDFDLPIGTFRLSFNRGAGGNKGVESIAKYIKTKAFLRVRVGIVPTTPAGKLKKPTGERAVQQFILGIFKPKEQEILRGIEKKVIEVLQVVLQKGRNVAMNRYN